MHDPHHAIGMDFYACGPQAKVHQRLLGKGPVGLDVATTQAEIGQLADRYGLGFLGCCIGSIGVHPGFQLFGLRLGNIDESHPRLSI